MAGIAQFETRGRASCWKLIWRVAEPEAVDLLLEVEQLGWLQKHVDAANAGRTCLYLVSCCAYLPEADDMAVLRTAYAIHLAHAKFPDAMRLALKLNDQARTDRRPPPDPRALRVVPSTCVASQSGCV